MFKVGEIVGIIRLKNAYDPYVTMVLGSYIDRMETVRKETAAGKQRKQSAQYKICKAMPDSAEYMRLKIRRFTQDAASLMQEAYEEIATLGEELNEWYNNLTESLQQTSKAEQIQESASTLENISEQDATILMSDINVVHFPSLDCESRPKRASEAADILRDVAAALQEAKNNYHESKPENNGEDPVESDNDEPTSEEATESDYDELGNIADQCESDADEVEGVEFPGMFG